MKVGEGWRTHLPAGVAAHLASWLTEPGSLTARCRRGAASFAVRLLGFAREAPLSDECAMRPQARHATPVREVLLECDGRPVIFAHTVLLTAARGRLACWMAGLGTRSLGSLLFAFPGFRRGRIEYRRLDARHPLYRRALAVVPDAPPVLWARRSRHALGREQVLVSEVFLPAIRRIR